MSHTSTEDGSTGRQAPMVYTLSIKSQIRYPAGLAPWTLAQYLLLDKKPTSLLRQIYGLWRTFPTALIYTPPSLGGCGEEWISDTSQLQKWTYLLYTTISVPPRHSLSIGGHEPHTTGSAELTPLPISILLEKTTGPHPLAGCLVPTPSRGSRLHEGGSQPSPSNNVYGWII